MLLASNQFCISQPRAVNFVLPAAHICLNLQPGFNSSPSPTCLSSCTAKPPPSRAKFLLFLLQRASIPGGFTSRLANGSAPDPNAPHGQLGWSRGDLGVLIVLRAISEVQIARAKLRLLERPAKVMARLERPTSKTLPVGKPASRDTALRRETASRSVKAAALRKKVVPASIKLSAAARSRRKHDLGLGVRADTAAAGVHTKCHGKLL